MTRRIKYIPKGQHQTMPVKSKKEIDNIYKYLLNQVEKARTPHKKWIADRNWMLVKLGFNTAFRGEDLIQLRVCDVADGYMHIKENKTGKVQNFKLNKKLHQEITDYIERNGLTRYDYMFNSRQRDGVIRAITRQQADNILTKVKKAVGITYCFSLHSLRKTFGYQFYLNGGKIETLRQMYNHSSSEVTKVYIMWDTTDAERAREDIYI